MNALKKNIILILLAVILIAAVSVPLSDWQPDSGMPAAAQNPGSGNKVIKWAKFDVPYSALSKALAIDIKSHTGGVSIGWVDVLSCLAAKYGGNWNKYKAKDMDSVVSAMQSEKSMAEITSKMKYYDYFHQVYDAVLGNFVGPYEAELPSPAGDGTTILKEGYGLKVFSPIPRNYGFSHYDDFGNSRSFGFSRRHLGNDLLGAIGTPIAAVEGGYVEALGWNKYGGWRIGIRSFDKKRYYYYAHLRKNHPYKSGLAVGSLVQAGDVIGYLGATGYSSTENSNNMNKPHLHFGMELIFDESQKESNNEIWIDVYNIVELLNKNRVQVKKINGTKDFQRAYAFIDLKYADLFQFGSMGKTSPDK